MDKPNKSPLAEKRRKMASINSGIDFLKRKKTPQSIVEQKEKINLGAFKEPFYNPNVEEAKVKGIPGLFKNFRLKKWHYFSFTSDQVILGLAVVDAGYAGDFFLYVYDFQSGKLVEMGDTSPVFIPSKVSDSSLIGHTEYKKGSYFIGMDYFYEQGYYTISINAVDKKGNSIVGDVKSLIVGEPLVNVREVDTHRLVYTHQNSIHRAEGMIKCNDKEYRFDPQKDFSGMDYTKGIHMYYTTWNWACAGGFAEDGTPIAINFAMDIASGGSNSIIVYWIKDKLYRVSSATFDYNHLDEDWHIFSPGKEVDILFKPAGKRVGTFNSGIFKFNFTQPFGHFQGKLNGEGDQILNFNDIRGVAEEHYAWW